MDLIAQLLGFGWVVKAWDKFRSFEPELAAAGLLLSGLGMMLSGAAGIIAQLTACQAMACAAGILQTLKGSADAALFLKGLVVFKGAWLGLILHARYSAAAAAGAPAAPQLPAAPPAPGQPGS